MTITGMLATEVMIRRGSSQDRESIGEFVAGLSATTRQRRFFNSLPYASPTLTQTMAMAEPGKLVLLALDGDVVVGHGMAVRSSVSAVDFGIVVADAYQGRGIGNRLLRGLIHGSAEPGVNELRCDILSENHFVLAWLKRALPGIRFASNGVTRTGRWAAGPEFTETLKKAWNDGREGNHGHRGRSA